MILFDVITVLRLGYVLYKSTKVPLQIEVIKRAVHENL